MRVPAPKSLQNVLNIPPYVAPNNTWTSGIVVVARVLEAFIRSPNLAEGTQDSNGMTNALARIVIDKEFGEVVTSVGNSTEVADQMDVSNRTLRALSFQLTDAYGVLLNMHNIDWSFELAFTFGPIE